MPSETNRRVMEIKRAIDAWATAEGHHVRHDDHERLASAIYKAIEYRYPKPIARKGILLDVAEGGDYCNPRIVNWEGADETLYPIDPATDEPVEEAVAHYALPLPRPDAIPEI